MVCAFVVYHQQAHTKTTSCGRYEINTFMQMLSLWLASFMQIARLQCSKFENARMDTVWQVWCVRCKSTHWKMCAVSMKTDRRTIWHSKCTQARTHTDSRGQMSVSPDIVRCQFKSVVFSCCRVYSTILTYMVHLCFELFDASTIQRFFLWLSE